MSSAAFKSLINSGETEHSTRRSEELRLHIPDYDRRRGIPVEERFREILFQIAPAVFAYRRSELRDDAETANLAEEAVYKANWALYGRPCDNLAGYVLTIFRHDADEYLQRNSKIISIDQETQGYSGLSSSLQTPEQVERQILIREALDALDDTTRWICLRRFVDGDSPELIGRELGISANSVSARLSRGLARIRPLFKQVAARRGS